MREILIEFGSFLILPVVIFTMYGIHEWYLWIKNKNKL